MEGGGREGSRGKRKEKRIWEQKEKHGVRSGLSDLTEAKWVHFDQNPFICRVLEYPTMSLDACFILK